MKIAVTQLELALKNISPPPPLRFRLKPNLVVWALALCLLLFAPLFAPPAAAQTTLYSGSMSAASLGYCEDSPGDPGVCAMTGSSNSGGSLSPLSFSVSGRRYKIRAFVYITVLSGGHQPGLYFALDSALPSGIAAQMTLTLNGSSWQIADAMASASPAGTDYKLVASSSPFTSGSTYTVSLTGPVGIGSSGSRSSRSRSKATPIPTATPLPPRTCEELPESVTVSGDGVGEQCRVITNAEGVGNDDIVEAGFLSALDVWSYLGRGVTVCFAQAGEIVLLDASTAPRAPYALDSETRNGETCAFIDRPGTVVLMSSDAPLLTTLPRLTTTRGLTATSTETVWTDCMVTATHNLNLREAPAGTIIGFVLHGWRLTAWQRRAGWYQVDALGVTGWISADYVTTDGDCA